MAVKKPGEVEGVQIVPQVVPKSGITEIPPRDEPKPATAAAPSEPTPTRAPTPVTERRATIREQAIRNVREREQVLGRDRSRVLRSWFWNGVEHHELNDGSVAKSTATGRTLPLGPNASSTALRLRPTVVAHNRGENPIQGIGDETRKSSLHFIKDIGVDAATILIPGVWVKDWDELSNRQRALNAAMDLVIFVPIIGPAARISTRASKAVIKTAIRAGSDTVEAAKVGRALNKIENGIVLGDGQAIREATVIIKESARKAGVNLDNITREVNRKADDIAEAGSRARKPDPPPDLKRNLKQQEKVVKKVDDNTKDIKGGGKPVGDDGKRRPSRPKAPNGNGARAASKEQFDKGSSVAIAEAADEARKAASLREILKTTRPLRARRIRPTERPRPRRKPERKDRKRIRARAAPRARPKPKAAPKAAPAPQRAPQRRVAPVPRALPATEAQAQEQPEPQRPVPRAPAPAAVGVGAPTVAATRVGAPTRTPTRGRTRIATEPPPTPTRAPPTAPPKAPPRGRAIAKPPGDPTTFEGEDFSFGLAKGTFARKVVFKQGAFWVTLTLDGSDPIFSRAKPPSARKGRTPEQTFKVVEFSERRPTQKMFDQGTSRVTVGGGGIRFRGI